MKETEQTEESRGGKLKSKQEFELFAGQMKAEQLEKEKHFASKSIQEREKSLDSLEKWLQERHSERMREEKSNLFIWK